MTVGSVALIGFGEVNQRFAADLRRAGVTQLSAWDVLFSDPNSPPSRAVIGSGVTRATGSAEAVTDADLVLCAVTAANDLSAAVEAAPAVRREAFFVDVNSASPRQKLESAQAIDAAGGRYVEAAVMSPIEPMGIGSPMLLGGRHAAPFVELARPLGFSGCTVYSERIGPAAATKMCRSIVIKGVEALLTESMLAARAWGVEREVLASLANLLPVEDWEALAMYVISRSLQHGGRRAEEMREAAKTVAEAGIEPTMSEAIATWQDWAAGHRHAMSEPSLEAMIDAIRAKLDATVS